MRSARVGMSAAKYYRAEGRSRRNSSRSAATSYRASCRTRLLAKAEDCRCRWPGRHPVTRQGLRTTASAAYTDSVELFPNYKYPIGFQFNVEGINMGAGIAPRWPPARQQRLTITSAAVRTRSASSAPSDTSSSNFFFDPAMYAGSFNPTRLMSTFRRAPRSDATSELHRNADVAGRLAAAVGGDDDRAAQRLLAGAHRVERRVGGGARRRGRWPAVRDAFSASDVFGQSKRRQYLSRYASLSRSTSSSSVSRSG